MDTQGSSKSALGQRELAKERIRRISGGSKPLTKAKKSTPGLRDKLQKQFCKEVQKMKVEPVEVKVENGNAQKQLVRRNSFPQFTQASSELPSVSSQIPGRRSSVDEKKYTPPQSSSSSTKYVDTPDLPYYRKVGENPRKSSFSKRKRQDNVLGWKGRGRYHRHTWQADREQEMRDYING